jgi:glycosyltransferase involved in cell wall biosynthesis
MVEPGLAWEEAQRQPLPPRTTPLRIVTIDEHYRRPEFDGGSRAISDLHRSLLELGHESVLANSPEPLQGQRWDIAIMSRPLSSLRWAAFARAAAKRTVLLGLDLHHRRLAAEQRADHGATDAARAMAVVERACWRLYDLSLYPCAQEVDHVNASGGRARWFPYFRIDAIHRPQRRIQDPHPPMLLFVGGAAHRPNVLGMQWFAEQVLPQLSVPGLQVVVVGHWPESTRSPLEQQGIAFAGQLNDHDLANCVSRATALIAPLTYGAGLKCKVIEALASGIPLVTTRVGLQGIDSVRDLSFCADTPQEWKYALHSIAGMPQLVEARVQAAGAYIRARHSRKPYLAAVRSFIATL